MFTPVPIIVISWVLESLMMFWIGKALNKSTGWNEKWVPLACAIPLVGTFLVLVMATKMNVKGLWSSDKTAEAECSA